MNFLGVYLVACLLLAVAGAAKTARPADTARAVTVATGFGSLAAVAAVVRVGAALEAALGTVAALWPRPVPAGAVAASYTAFAVFTGWVRHRGGPLATCGCFGTADTPATRLHVAVDVTLAAAAGAAAAAGWSGDLFGLLARQPAAGAPLVGASLLGTGLVFLVLSAGGKLHATRRLVAGAPPP